MRSCVEDVQICLHSRASLSGVISIIGACPRPHFSASDIINGALSDPICSYNSRSISTCEWKGKMSELCCRARKGCKGSFRAAGRCSGCHFHAVAMAIDFSRSKRSFGCLGASRGAGLWVDARRWSCLEPPRRIAVLRALIVCCKGALLAACTTPVLHACTLSADVCGALCGQLAVCSMGKTRRQRCFPRKCFRSNTKAAERSSDVRFAAVTVIIAA